MGRQTVESRALNAGLSTHKSCHPIFDLGKANDKLFKFACKKSPHLEETVEFLRHKLVVPIHSVSTIESHFYRLPGHNRCFSYALTQSEKIEEVINSDVIVFKGAEPLMGDFSNLIKWMSAAPFARNFLADQDAAFYSTIGDHFPLREGKVPGVLTLVEAEKEAQIALQVHAAYFDRYHELAPMPLPLLIHKYSDEDFKKTTKVLESHLSKPAMSRSKEIFREGLGIYMYYFPASILRLGDCADEKTQSLLEKQRVNLPTNQGLTESWVQLFVRPLQLKFFPTTEWSSGLGDCFDIGNATELNGGCCDLDSIVPFSESRDSNFFYIALLRSLEILNELIFFNLKENLASRSFSILIHKFTLDLICENIEKELAAGGTFDPRILKLFKIRNSDDFEAIRDEFKIYSSSFD